MANFKLFSEAVEENFSAMQTCEELFKVGDADALWNLYLDSFPVGTNEVFNVSREYDCSCCKSFIRNFGNVVALKDGKLESIWDLDENAPEPFATVANSMRKYLTESRIESVFRCEESSHGAKETVSLIKESLKTVKFNHFYSKVAPKWVSGKNTATVKGEKRSNYDVFKRGMTALNLSDMDTVLDLIDSNSLYRGEEHAVVLEIFRNLKDKFDKLKSDADREYFLWENLSYRVCTLRNTVIGTLLVDLSEGKDLEEAVRAFEFKVAPQNYKRPTALITPKMVDNALATLNELGLESALNRRLAEISDISVNNVLWLNRKLHNQVKGDLKSLLMSSTKPSLKPKVNSKVTIEEFMSDYLPVSESIKILFKRANVNNLVTLTAPVDSNVKNLFKWGNNFAWSYNGDFTDSIKERVKRAGGNVEADLRFSLAWSNRDDLDIHILTPSGNHICFHNKCGALDVDMNAHQVVSDPVENVSFNKPATGVYKIIVNNYNKRDSSNGGFTLELADSLGSKQYSLSHNNVSKTECLSVSVKNSIISDIKVSSKDLKFESKVETVWGITTGKFYDVKSVMFSPNYWDDKKIGNKHWFFLVDSCQTDSEVRGIYNEFLDSRLEPHRKVFEILGSKTKCAVTNDQLSGLGFSSTKKDVITVEVIIDSKKQLLDITF
jgi:hypothetical protein